MAARIGVLALQGDFAAHLQTLRSVGAVGVEVRDPAALEGLNGLILPGGESTALLKLMEDRGFTGAITGFAERGGAVFGTCAGAILLARRVVDPHQQAMGLVDMEIRRNAFGRQRESFEISCPAPAFGDPALDLVFIRAPRILALGPGVEVLVALKGEPVMVRQGRILACTFHPELSADGRIHRYFTETARLPALAGS
jgi:5'-phosphate synthase pdxT subunit